MGGTAVTTNQRLPIVRRTYDRLAASYDRRWRHYIDATLDLTIESLELAGTEKLLDLACGTGELERRLLPLYPRLWIVGLDASPNMLRAAGSKELDAVWLVADAARLPVADAQFDRVVCANSFHYFDAPRAALGEMRRVLRPTGSLVLVDWCDDYLTCKLCSVWLRWTDPAFHRTYTLGGCRRLLEEQGFEIHSARRKRIDWLWGLMALVCRPR